jgi:ElaB/YqjD/DUF883 family membrane-anchored ribosome-binding protein
MTTNTNETSGTTTVGNDEAGRLSAAADKVRGTASAAYSAARERTSAVYDTARQSASRAGQATTQNVGSYPVAALVGGVAAGALLAFVLPRTQREQQTLGRVGQRITDAAREAAHSAAEAGREQVNQLPAAAMQKVGEAVVGAVTAAGTSNAQ